MKTTGGIVSTVCYAEENYVVAKMTQSPAVAFWALIEHPTYTNEQGEERKRHLHLIIEPKGRIDLEALAGYLAQPSPDPEEKPLGCMPFRKSVESEWLPYILHDSDYMRYKRLQKPYYNLPLETVRTNDPERVKRVYDALPRDKWQSWMSKIYESWSKGESWLTFVDREYLPISTFAVVRRAWIELDADAYREGLKDSDKKGEEVREAAYKSMERYAIQNEGEQVKLDDILN